MLPPPHITGQCQAGGRHHPPRTACLPKDLQRATGRSGPGPTTPCARTCDFGCLRDCGSRSCGVDLLCGRLGWCAEWCVVSDAVAVSVGGDHAGSLAPGRDSSSVGGRRSNGLHPRHARGQRAVEYGVGAGLDQCFSLVERRAHSGVDHSVRAWNEAGDESRWLVSPAGACGPGGRTLDSVVEDGGDVVGVVESARSDEARQERFDVVVVGLGASEFGRERADRFGLDGTLGLFVGEPGAADEGCPAIVLGDCGDGLVLGSELSDRAPMLLLGHDGLVSRELGPTVLQNAIEHASRRGMRIVAGVWLRMVVGTVESHVGVVRVPPSGHRDVEGLPRRGRFDQDVRGVRRDALRAVCVTA